jgi:hypothetical protein
MLGYGASLGRYSYTLGPFTGTLTLEGPDVWQGVVTGAFSGGGLSGNVNVTEL